MSIRLLGAVLSFRCNYATDLNLHRSNTFSADGSAKEENTSRSARRLVRVEQQPSKHDAIASAALSPPDHRNDTVVLTSVGQVAGSLAEETVDSSGTHLLSTPPVTISAEEAAAPADSEADAVETKENTAWVESIGTPGNYVPKPGGCCYSCMTDEIPNGNKNVGMTIGNSSECFQKCSKNAYCDYLNIIEYSEQISPSTWGWCELIYDSQLEPDHTAVPMAPKPPHAVEFGETSCYRKKTGKERKKMAKSKKAAKKADKKAAKKADTNRHL